MWTFEVIEDECLRVIVFKDGLKLDWWTIQTLLNHQSVWDSHPTLEGALLNFYEGYWECPEDNKDIVTTFLIARDYLLDHGYGDKR